VFFTEIYRPCAKGETVDLGPRGYVDCDAAKASADFGGPSCVPPNLKSDDAVFNVMDLMAFFSEIYRPCAKGETVDLGPRGVVDCDTTAFAAAGFKVVVDSV
jgi:hypothetical protein